MSFPIIVPDVQVYSGDSFSMKYILKTGTPPEPINLVAEGWESWNCQFRQAPSDTEFISLIIDLTDADEGVIIIRATPEQTAQITSGVWDLQASREGEVRTWLRGTFNHVLDVTRV